jgi:hypothetical protein
MDDASSSFTPAETTPQITANPIQPVPEQPPEQEQQTANPDQLHPTSSSRNPPTAGVSQSAALAGKSTGPGARSEGASAPEAQSFIPTGASTIDELIKAAYFVADGIDEPTLDVVSPHQVNVHYPADGSLAIIRIEARPGAWGGVQNPMTPEAAADANQRYNAYKDAATQAPPPEELAQQESHDDATAREDSKPQ